MPSNFVEERPAPRRFKMRKDDMYLERDLPEQAVKALEVVGKVCDKINLADANATDRDEIFTFVYTIQQARKAYATGIAYGVPCRRAYLPPVIRHLLVGVAKNFKDPVPVVQAFTNNKRFQTLLDAAWR